MNSEIQKKLPVIACGVALVRRGREFLISQRNANDSFGSLWEFPGGKKNQDESFEDCCARETLEETGVTIRVEKKLMELRRQYNEREIWLNFYICAYISGEPQPLDCQNVQWVDVQNLSQFPFPPANNLVIEKLLKEYA